MFELELLMDGFSKNGYPDPLPEPIVGHTLTHDEIRAARIVFPGHVALSVVPAHPEGHSPGRILVGFYNVEKAKRRRPPLSTFGGLEIVYEQISELRDASRGSSVQRLMQSAPSSFPATAHTYPHLGPGHLISSPTTSKQRVSCGVLIEFCGGLRVITIPLHILQETPTKYRRFSVFKPFRRPSNLLGIKIGHWNQDQLVGHTVSGVGDFGDGDECYNFQFGVALIQPHPDITFENIVGAGDHRRDLRRFAPLGIHSMRLDGDYFIFVAWIRGVEIHRVKFRGLTSRDGILLGVVVSPLIDVDFGGACGVPVFDSDGTVYGFVRFLQSDPVDSDADEVRLFIVDYPTVIRQQVLVPPSDVSMRYS